MEDKNVNNKKEELNTIKENCKQLTVHKESKLPVNVRVALEIIKHNALKAIIPILTVICVIAILLVDLMPDSHYIGEVDPELALAMTYDEYQKGEEIVDGTDKCVEFSAFFLRDLDGDGTAEKIKGTCKQIGEEDTLYLETKVLTEGELRDGIITIDSQNFYYNTAIVKDDYVKNNCIGANSKTIELNTMQSGTQKLLTGKVRSGNYDLINKRLDALGKDPSKYSKVNKVTFTGTYVNNGVEKQIKKEINLNVDWYAKTQCIIPDTYKNYSVKNRTLYIGSNKPEKLTLNYPVITQETANRAILSKSYIEGTIPEINGYKPTNVKITGTNVEYTYDETTGKYTAWRNASIDENGNVTTNAYSEIYNNNTYNEYNFIVQYPGDAYDTLQNYEQVVMPVSAYYEGYNNTNEEFASPYRSEAVNEAIVLSLEIEPRDQANVNLIIGEYLQHPYTRYTVSKEKPAKIYNGISQKEEKDYYIEQWRILTGLQNNITGIIVKDTRNLLSGESEIQKTDEFIYDNSTTSVQMGDIVKYVGLYFDSSKTSILGALGSDGWIKIYDDETNELLKEFTVNETYLCIEENPYYYKEGVNHIRVETSAPINNQSGIWISNIKEIDDEKLTTRYSKEEFNRITHIRGKAVCYGKFNTDGTESTRYLNTSERSAVYENKLSVATIETIPQTISTQAETGCQIKIHTIKNENNHEMGWKNGTFLVKLPPEIIDLQVNSVNISGLNAKIDNYEVYEEGGNFYIKIYTSNEIELDYYIIVDCNLSANPLISTIESNVELYSVNEIGYEYYYSTEDKYDLNNNRNIIEKIGYWSYKTKFISPNSLLTSTIAGEFDNIGTTAIAPRIAHIDKNQRSAKVSLNLTNNYVGTISDIVVIGKIPFEGNSYIINGRDLGSEFSVTMQNSGIEIPAELQPYAKVYYSANENPTVHITDEANGWVTKEEVTDWNSIKSYIVVLENFEMPEDNNYVINYRINIPEGLNYNNVAYCTHAVYFSLNTNEGKYRTSIESSKLGIMVAKQYDLELTKYQINLDKKVSGATYSVTDTGTNKSRTAVTGEDGILVITGLYAGKTYKIKEIKTPNEYALNEEEIIIKTSADENDNLQVNIESGKAKNINTLKEEGKDWKVTLEVEDEPKARVEITKKDKVTGMSLSGVQFRITGRDKLGTVLTTKEEGKVTSNGLYLGAEYTLEETKANGYFLNNPIKFMIQRDNNDSVGASSARPINEQYSYTITEGTVKNSELIFDNGIPVLKLEIENEPRPTYTLEIIKVEKDQIATSIVGAKFEINGPGMDSPRSFTTDEFGAIEIDKLYIGTDETEAVEYTLTETEAPTGYIKIQPITFKVYREGDNLVYQTIEGQVKESNIDGSTVSLIIEDEPVFKLVKKDGTTSEALPNVKFAIYSIDITTNEETFALNTRGEIIGEPETINGKEYRVIKTNENGQITADLGDGLYKVVELETLEQYELPEDIEERSYYFGIGNVRAGGVEAIDEWYTIIDNGNASIVNTIQTSDGGYLVNGYFMSPTLTLTKKDGTKIELTNNGSQNCFIIKYNENREIEWADSIGGTGSDRNYDKIIETTDGNYILAGHTSYNSVDITLSNGDKLISQGKSDIVIVKYDKNGNILWSDLIGGSYNDDIYAIEPSSDGGVILGGSSQSASLKSQKTEKEITHEGSYAGLVLKYDKDGNIEWCRWTETGRIHGIQETEDKGYLTVGNCFNTITLPNGETVTSKGSDDLIVIKYDTKGNIIWYDVIGGSGSESHIYDLRNQIFRTYDGGYLVTGNFSSDSIILSNGDELYSGGTQSQGFIIKYNENGKIEWSKMIYGADFRAMTVTRDGGFAIIRYNNDYRLEKYDKNGEIEWKISVYDWGKFGATNVLETEEGKYILGGSYGTEITLPSGTTIPTTNTESKSIIVQYDIKVTPKVENLGDVNTIPAVTRYDSTWGSIIGGETTAEDEIYNVYATSDRGYIAGIYYQGTITIKETEITSKGNKDAMVIKYDENNEIQWYDTFGGIGEDKINGVTEVEGGYIAVGSFIGTINLSNGDTVTSNGNADSIIIKYDTEGHIVWYDTVGSSNADSLNGVVKIKNGDIIAIGNYNGGITLSNGDSITNSSQDGIIMCYNNTTGEIKWHKEIKGNKTDDIQSMCETEDGGFIIIGRSESTGQFIPGSTQSISNRGSGDVFVTKFDAEGNPEWVDHFGGKGNEQGYSVIQTSDGGYAVGGTFNENITLSTREPVKKGGHWNDGIIIKYDSKGNIEWHKEVYSDDSFVWGLTKLKDGNFIAIVRGRNGSGEYSKMYLSSGEQLPRIGYLDSIITKFSNEGKLLANKRVPNSAHTTVINSTTQLTNGDIIVCGKTNFIGTLSLDNGQNLKKLDQSTENYDGMIVRFTERELSPEIEGKLELTVPNSKKEYKIQTNVKALNGTKGGSISGQTELVYETVQYGNTNTKQITMTPAENYEIIKITVNGEDYPFTANENGTYTMPAFTNITEDKQIEVTYGLSSNKLMIEKVDSEDNSKKLEGAKLRLERITSEDDTEEYEIELTTNADGQAIASVPYGTYKVTELEAPEAYSINEAIENIEFTENGDHTFTIQDKQKPKVIIHHYLKDREGNETETEVAETQIIHGEKGESYNTFTEEKISMNGYELEKDSEGEYKIPENAVGTYGEGETIVNYYYKEKEIKLTVHYYVEGTEERVPLQAGGVAEDIEKKGYEGESYETMALENMSEKYELKETPENAIGTYGKEEITVIYYYKLKTYNITTKVLEKEETNEIGEAVKVKGGAITGEGETPYEEVEHGESSKKEITITPNEGYKIKTVKINENIIYPETQTVSNEDTTTPVGAGLASAQEDEPLTLDSIENITENKEITVEFEKKTGTVTVHHYIKGTENKVPSKVEGEVVQDEIKTGYVGSIYATKTSENHSEMYEYYSVEGQTSGQYKEEAQEVTYYYILREPIITSEKTYETENNKPYVVNGEKITYTITIKNEGRLEKAVTVKDVISDKTTLVEGSVRIDGQVQGEITKETLQTGIQITVPREQEGIASVKTLSFEVIVNEQAKGEIVNQAEVDGENTNEVKTQILDYTSTLTKQTEQTKVTSKDEKVKYTITFIGEIKALKGKAIVTMVDTLQYPINKDESILAGGEYDEETKTITWVEEINNIDTYTNEDTGKLEITKEITIKYNYENINEAGGKIVNVAESTMEIQEEKEDGNYEKIGEVDAKTEEIETLIEIQAQVIVHHYIYNREAETESNKYTKTKLVEDQTIEGMIGQEYTTAPSTEIPANYVCIEGEPENHAGKMEEGTIEVSYYYELINETLENEIEQKAETGKYIMPDGTITSVGAGLVSSRRTSPNIRTRNSNLQHKIQS